MESADGSEESDDRVAVLPDTGAVTGLQLIGSLGLFLTTGGLGLIGASRRRPSGQDTDVDVADDPQDDEPAAGSDAAPARRNARVVGGIGLALLLIALIAKTTRSLKD